MRAPRKPPSHSSPAAILFIRLFISYPITNKNKQSGEESMTRQTSKGTCSFCHREFSKASMTRHLEACEQRAAIQAEAGSHQKARQTRTFHLVVEGYRLPMYWMHLEVSVGTTLATLDRFLRDTWLECCGHLSAFEIGGVRYSVDAAIYEWDTGSKNMQVPLDQVLHPG